MAKASVNPGPKRSWRKRRCNQMTPFPHQPRNNNCNTNAACIYRLPGFWVALVLGVGVYAVLF